MCAFFDNLRTFNGLRRPKHRTSFLSFSEKYRIETYIAGVIRFCYLMKKNRTHIAVFDMINMRS